NRDRNRVLIPYAAGTLGAIILFFLATTCFKANPFARLDWTPMDGRGMNPQLQNPGMAIHPPNLYLGYVATAVPFAFAIAALVTFLLSIFGTFITRSGVVESVHSFAQSPVGSWFAAFFFLATGTTIYLVATRLRNLEAKAELESLVSREAAFLYNNLVLVGIAFAVLWGTLFPILSEWVRAEKITVGPPFFNAVNRPLGLLLLALTGIGPLIAWRKASIANLKRQFVLPAACGLLLGGLLAALGMERGYALVTYTLSGF